MSGIFGILTLDGSPVEREHLDTMMRAMAHLGPDGNGLWMDSAVGLGQLLLHDTPESLHARFPSRNRTGDLILAASARIDNREDLCRAFDTPSSEAPQVSDSDLILQAYEKWGEECPQHLLGSFAFAVWDSRNRSLFCARDQIGLRPLYYLHSGDRFIFSSEIRGIRCLPFVSIRLNEDTLAAALLPITLDGSQTFYQGIRQIEPAHTLKLHDGGVTIRRYWQLEPRGSTCLSDRDYAEALRDLIEQSILCRLRTAFPIGILLSGGLDSSSIACIAARKLKEKGEGLVAVSSVLPEHHQGPESDERPHIRTVLEQEENIEVQYVTAEDLGPFDGLEEKFDRLDFLVNPYHYVERALLQVLARQGVRAILLGLPGDGTASYDGRDSLARLIEQMRWRTVFRIIGETRRVEGISLWEIIGKRILPFLAPGPYDRLRHLKRRAWREPRMDIASVANSRFAKRYRHDMEAARASPSFHLVHYRSALMRMGHAGKRAMKSELMSSGFFGMEICLPFWDRRLMEFLVSVPPEQFLLGGWRRSLFRRAMEGILPEPIRWRGDKLPFAPGFPRRIMGVRDDVRGFLASILDDASKRDFVGQYIDISAVQRHVLEPKLLHAGSVWDFQTAAAVAMGIIAIRFLLWLRGRFAVV